MHPLRFKSFFLATLPSTICPSTGDSYDGKSAHTPGQVDVCNSVYSPTPQQLADAKQFIEMQEAHYAGDFGERNEYYLTTWTLPAEGVIIRGRRGPKKT